MRRGAIHRPEVLDAMLDDLRDTAPEQILITGDLTNVSLESEFPLARDWLGRIGSPERVTLVPGNHDAYVRVARARSWDLWSGYLESDAAGRELLGRGRGGSSAHAPIEVGHSGAQHGDLEAQALEVAVGDDLAVGRRRCGRGKRGRGRSRAVRVASQATEVRRRMPSAVARAIVW